MKKIVTSLLLVFCIGSKAQTGSGGSAYSLQQAVDYAFKNSPSVLNSELDATSSVYRKRELLSVGYPQISSSVDFKDYINIPTSLLPAQFFGGPAGSFIPVKFGTKYNATVGLSASQLVFSTDYFFGTKAAKQLVNLSTISITRTKSEVAAQVTKAYYGVLVSKERVKLLDANVVKLQKVFSDTKALNAQGFVEKIDVDRIEVTLNNLMSEKEKVDRLIQMSELLLKFQMGYKGSDNLILSDSLNMDSGKFENLGMKPDISSRSELKLLETQGVMLDIDVKRLKWGALPTIAAYGALNYNAQRTEFDLFDASKDWYNISLIGATLNLNLFNGFQRYSRIQQAKIALTKNNNSITQFKMAAELEASMASITYNNALSSIQTQKRNLELAQSIFEVTQKKYTAGVGSNTELINAQTSIKEAETNYFGALYDLLIAKTDYLKATGALVK